MICNEKHDEQPVLKASTMEELVEKYPFLKGHQLNAFRRFDMNKAQTANNNMEIAMITASQEYPEPMCFTKADWGNDFSFQFPSNFGGLGFTISLPVQCRPVACLLEFIQSKEVPGTSKYTLEKKKGSVVIKSFKTVVQASASAGIFGCEAKMSVTTGFDYSETITNEVTETWEETLTQGSYYTFQNNLVYVYRIYDKETFDAYDASFKIKDNCGFTIYEQGGHYYFFIPVKRDDPFTKVYKNDFYSTIARDDLYKFLVGDGYWKW